MRTPPALAAGPLSASTAVAGLGPVEGTPPAAADGAMPSAAPPPPEPVARVLGRLSPGDEPLRLPEPVSTRPARPRVRSRKVARLTTRRLGVSAALVDGRLLPGDVEVSDGTVSAVGLPPAAGDRIAAPGYVDLQVNGFAGVRSYIGRLAPGAVADVVVLDDTLAVDAVVSAGEPVEVGCP